MVSTGEKLKVFISYSRQDAAEFADELVAGLELAGFAPFIDRHDIAAGEDWETRLGSLIAQSDTVVYVVTPQATKSERCVWEVDRTIGLSKRLLPVIYKAVPDAHIPDKLRRLQFVRFDTGSGITRSLAQLAAALRQDIDWIREHTRLGELAARWSMRGKPESLLLRGDDLDVAKAWATSRKGGAPEITEAHRAYLAASDDAEVARLGKEHAQLREILKARSAATRLLWSIGVLIFGIGIGFGWSRREYLQLQIVTLMDAIWPIALSPTTERALRPGQRFTECAYCPEMVVLPAGEFLMGSPDSEMGHQKKEEPQHRVAIRHRYAVSRFEITFKEWDACFTLGGCKYSPSDQDWGRNNRPVINVNFEDAQQYVAWLSGRTGKTYRLLSEAEWEYAARAGGDQTYSWGNEIGKGNSNCKGCGSQWDLEKTAPVGSFRANAFDLHDMHGNVFEWTQDCFHDTYNGAPEDGSAWIRDGDCERRFVRGGAWDVGPEAIRSARRWELRTSYRSSDVGFRVGRTLSDVPQH